VGFSDTDWEGDLGDRKSTAEAEEDIALASTAQ